MPQEVPKRSRRDHRDTAQPKPDCQPQPLQLGGADHLKLDLSALDLEGAVFQILTLLPFHKVYELRTVCKAWNFLLRSPVFLRSWSTSTSSAEEEEGEGGGWLVMMRKKPGPFEPPCARELLAYDLAAARWISLDPLLRSLPSPALSNLGGPSLQFVFNPFDERVGVFGASGGAPGLVCFLTSPIIDTSTSALSHAGRHALIIDGHGVVFDPSIFSLLVVNLLTGSHHNLPPPLKHCKELASWFYRALLVSMQPLPDNAYRVFLHRQRVHFPGPLEIYDSRSGRWKAGKSCDDVHDAKIATPADIEQADFLRFLEEYSGSYVLFAYRVESDEWSRVKVDARYTGNLPRTENLWFPNPLHFTRYKGRIFVAALRINPFALVCSRGFVGFVVWELRMDRSVPPDALTPGADWVEVSRSPQNLGSTYGISNRPVVAVTSFGSVMCMIAASNVRYNYWATYLPPFVYNLASDSWYHLPPYERGNDFLAAFALQPNFIATP